MNFKKIKEMLRGALFIGLTAVMIACQASAGPKEQKIVPGMVNIMPEPQQGLIARELVKMIERYNFKEVKINDSISSVILDNYIKKLDGSRNYFLASDIKEFEAYRYTLDDDLRNGDLGSTFHIFNIYLKRYNDFIDFSLKQVSQPFSFKTNESYTYDREKMPWISSQTGLNEQWKKRVKYDLVNLKIAGTTPEKSVETIRKRYENVKSQNSKINSQDVFQIIMDAFTNSIDPHTNYYNPRNAEAYNEEMARTFDGIGASLKLENEILSVERILPGGPAFKSKQLHAGDRIIAIAQGDGEFEDIIGWRIDNSVSKIKGPRGTKVRLKIIPAGMEMTAKPVIVEFIREQIVREDESAQKEIQNINFEGRNFKMGVITVPGFYADFKAMQAGDKNYKSTTRDVKLILDTLKNIDKVDGILMDFRANGGGSLLEAIELTGLFIDKGPVVQVKELGGNVSVSNDPSPGAAWNGPLGIMVDRLSASATEIFAGAIQDYGRGIIMGTQTYGKGTVQSVIDLNRIVKPNILEQIAAAIIKKDTENKKEGVAARPSNLEIPEMGQINLTMGKFYRISGGSTQHKGVVPDISFPSIYPVDKIGEDTEPAALPYDYVAKSNYSKLPLSIDNIKDQLLKNHQDRMVKSLEFKYLLEDIQELNRRSSEVSISLNEDKLKAERDLLEAKNLKRANEIRAVKGLPLLKKGDKITKETTKDFLKDESLRIIADYIVLNNQVALRN